MKSYYQIKTNYVLPEKIYRSVRAEIAAYPEYKLAVRNFEALSENDVTEKNIVDKVAAEKHIKMIEDALQYIPEQFREAVFEHCALGADYLDLEDKYHYAASTFKIYVQMYVFGYATETGENINVNMGRS